MRLGRSLAISLATLAGVAVLPGACGVDGIVGGTCGSTLTNCSNRCVNLMTDRLNCGRCGNQCEPDVACIRGFCGGEGGWAGANPNGGSGNHGRDGGSGDAGYDPDAQGDAFGEFDVVYPDDGAGGGNAGGSGNRGGGTSSNAGGAGGFTAGDGGPICVPPYDTAEHCGTCNTVCSEPTRVCAPVDGKYQCKPYCDAPLVECNGACVDLKSDSDNCGQCARACPSAICQGGTCIGAQAGDIVAICMNFSATSGAQPTKLLGNSVLLPVLNQVKILAYDEFADPNVRARVDAIIEAASLTRRAYRTTSISQPELVNQQLKKPDFDVFLVYEQSRAPAGTLASYGTQWAKTLESFSYVGGVIVVLDGATGTKEMGQLLTNARLLEVTSASAVTAGTWVFNRQAGDVIGSSVVSPFRAEKDSCVFTTPTPTDNLTHFIVTDDVTPASAQRPLVVHRVTIPPVQ